MLNTETETTMKNHSTFLRGKDGYLTRAYVHCDDHGVPMTSSGYEYLCAGMTRLTGWGSADGQYSIWAHATGGHEVLIPITE